MSGSERPIASIPWIARFEMIGLASTAQRASTAWAIALRPEVICSQKKDGNKALSAQLFGFFGGLRFRPFDQTHSHLRRKGEGDVDVVDNDLWQDLRLNVSMLMLPPGLARLRTFIVFCVVLRGLPSLSFSVWPMMGVASEPASVKHIRQ